LLPVYILKIRKNRLKHIALVTTGITLVIVSTLIVFSDRLLIYAMRLPLLTPVLSELGFMSNTLYTIENGTTSDLTLSVPLANIDFADILDGFILPYAGLILSALISILLARDKLKVLLIIPGFFLFLSVTHYLGSLGYCSTCILPYTSYYAVIGAMCFGVSIAILSQKNKHKPLQNFIICGSLTISVIIMNYLSSGLATRTEYKFYPTAMFKNDRPIAEKEETEQLAAFIKKHTDPTSQILPIHNLITIPYAIFLAERSLPPQGINLKHSYRSIKSNLSDIKKERTIKALQYEGLWSDEILEIWLAKTYNTIIFQMDPRPQSSRLKEKIELNFVKTASTGHRGYNVHIYHRAHNQQQHNTE
jgi:hypothetical protein